MNFNLTLTLLIALPPFSLRKTNSPLSPSLPFKWTGLYGWWKTLEPFDHKGSNYVAKQFLEILDRLGWNPWQHPRQSLGKSKLFPGAAIAKLSPSLVFPFSLCCCLCMRAISKTLAVTKQTWMGGTSKMNVAKKKTRKRKGNASRV